MPTVLTQGDRPGAALMSEGNFHISREEVFVAEEAVILMNGLGAAIAKAAAITTSQSFTGTGNGVLTMADPAYSSRVMDGKYKVTLITVAANGGVFRVERPDGTEIGNATVGQAFNKEIKFTIADGATDFVVGDEFIIEVAADAEDFIYVPYNPAGTDGSEAPTAYFPYGATGAADGEGDIVKATAVTNDAELNGNCIAWPEGITAAQKANAIQSLRERNIKVRY